jgi:branched-chain amino acid transport system ATP-binding protein
MLVVDGLEAAYGLSQVLFGVTLRVDAGRLVTLLGRNGMGKTTTVRAMMGLIPVRAGRVRFDDVALDGLPPHRIAQAGLGLVPEGRQVFPNLSVYENLVATAGNRRHATEPWTVERVYALFPPLAARARSLGGTLSGGEQQMLAIGRALMTNPKLLILDEATEGLAPLVRAEIWRCLAALKAAGLSILLIDKNVEALTRLAGHHRAGEGRVVWDASAELRASAASHRYLGYDPRMSWIDPSFRAATLTPLVGRVLGLTRDDDRARHQHLSDRPPRPDPARHQRRRGRLRAAVRTLPGRARLEQPSRVVLRIVIATMGGVPQLRKVSRPARGQDDLSRDGLPENVENLADARASSDGATLVAIPRATPPTTSLLPPRRRRSSPAMWCSAARPP